MADIIPIFPLSHVLVPGMPLPLRIFEPRYRDMLADVTSGQGQGSFGVVALHRGTETDSVRARWGEGDIAPVGTIAEIMQVDTHDDGAAGLLTVGSSRFRIRRLITEGTAYLRAEVDRLAEVDGALGSEQVPLVRTLCAEIGASLAALTGRQPQQPLPEDPNQLSYFVASHIPLSPADRQDLLGDATAAERLHRAVGLLRREIRLVRGTRTVAIAPSVLWMIAESN